MPKPWIESFDPPPVPSAGTDQPPPDDVEAGAGRVPSHSLFDCNHGCTRHGGVGVPAVWDDYFCDSCDERKPDVKQYGEGRNRQLLCPDCVTAPARVPSPSKRSATVPEAT